MGFYTDEERLRAAQPLPVNGGRGDESTPLGTAAGKAWSNYGPVAYKENGVDVIGFGPQRASYSNEGRGVPVPIQAASGPEAYAPRGVTSGGTPDKFTADGLDIKGAASRIQGGYGQPQRGASVYNTYDPDRPASMGATENDPWKDMARQLATFSALRTREPQTIGFASLPDYAAQQNADFDRRHMFDSLAMNKSNPEAQALYGQLMLNAYKEYGDQQAKQGGIDVAYDRNRVAERGNELEYAGRTATENARALNQERLVGLQGQNQLALAGLQGRNQLDNTQLHGQLGYLQALALQREKAAADAADPSRLAMAEYYKSGAKLHGAQADAAQRAADFDKSADGSIQKWAATFMKEGGLSPDEAIAKATKMYLGAKRAGEQQRYADGGEVRETPEQLMARMNAKYGIGVPTAGTARPAPQPVPQPAPAPQQPQGVATGQGIVGILRGRQQQIDNAVKYADGGPIDVSGRQVLGAGTPKSDSLPAIIDGQHPAALSTNEFVMPDETVRYFGLAKLNKMVEQSRKGLDTGRQQR